MIDRRALLNQPFSQPDSPHSQQQQHQAEMGAAEGEVAVVCALSAIQLASADDTLLGPMALAISQELVSLVGNACQAFDPATNAVDWPLSFKLGARALLLSGRRLGTKPAFLHRPEAQVSSKRWVSVLKNVSFESFVLVRAPTDLTHALSLVVAGGLGGLALYSFFLRLGLVSRGVRLACQTQPDKLGWFSRRGFSHTQD